MKKIAGDIANSLTFINQNRHKYYINHLSLEKIYTVVGLIPGNREQGIGNRQQLVVAWQALNVALKLSCGTGF
ncbi:hypothetical protein [Anabaena sp. 4-3]|uniref:hypothetical protein n=1 Tax=Anabaena sp. 4-3 TaxID=1811979 RepID=UPI00082D66F3|nr:hypothetical protein [Anabaena sp. 4-3]